MSGRDPSAWVRLVAEVADRLVVTTVQDMQHSIGAGVFRWLGAPGRPVQRIYDAMTTAVTGAVRTGIVHGGAVAASIASQFDAPGEPSAAGVRARGIVNGTLSEQLLGVAPALSIDMSLRRDGRRLDLSPEGLMAAHPDASGRIVVFVHGLAASELDWTSRWVEAGWEPPPQVVDDGYAGMVDIAADSGATPLVVRYASGGSIGRSGADLADLLDAVVTHWPVPVTDVTVVAHSMGGLVVRAACHTAGVTGDAWLKPLSTIMYLGSPHLGAWLEKTANVVSWALRHDTRSAPIGALLEHRSRGIKDLGFGTLVDHDPTDGPPDGLEDAGVDVAPEHLDEILGLLLGDPMTDEPWLEDVTHHLVVGRLAHDDGHLVNRMLGDGMVRASSATGASGRRSILGEGRVVVTSVAASHNELLHDPKVASLLRSLLDSPSLG